MNYISPRFQSRIQAHIIANMMKTSLPGTPVVMAIHGEPGTGKSFQLEHSLIAAETYYKTISSSELESDHANDPAKLLRSTYLEVADEVSRNGYYSGALVINDIDSALGDWGELVQTTVNRQLVIGELQHITDFPTSVANSTNLRIPIFLTANDLTKLYEPLLRPGRTVSFFWSPTLDELCSMLQPLLPRLSDGERAELVSSIGVTSIAQYVDLIRETREIFFRSHTLTFRESIHAARHGKLTVDAAPSLPALLEAWAVISAEAQNMQDYSRNEL